jgi:hypothetical protein
MNYLFAAMATGAAGIMLGGFYRFYCALFFLSFTYFFLIEQAKYLNHFYLISLLSFLMLLVHANRWASIDRLWSKSAKIQTVPFWNLFLLRTQLVIVYFYSGVAKLNHDWLRGEPLNHWLEQRINYPIIGVFLEEEWVRLYVFSYGGLLFDLLIGFALLWKRTRVLALIPLCIFHIANSFIFSIGVFPWLMLASTIVFFEPGFPRKCLQRLWEHVPHSRKQKDSRETDTTHSEGQGFKKITLAFIGLWFIIQLIVPLRHFLFPGIVHWTEEGHRFAWHMKLRSKRGFILFRVQDGDSDTSQIVDPSERLSYRQLRKLSTRPYLILLYAHHLRDRAIAQGMKKPIVNAFSFASLNGRPFQPLIDPNANLADTSYPVFSHADWIVPLRQEATIGRYTPFDPRQIKALLRRSYDKPFPTDSYQNAPDLEETD